MGVSRRSSNGKQIKVYISGHAGAMVLYWLSMRKDPPLLSWTGCGTLAGKRVKRGF